MRKIAIINQKGGVAKTTTALNLASGLIRNDKKVLLIDLDPQGNVGTSILKDTENGVYEFLFKEEMLDNCITNVSTNFDVMSSRENLTRAEYNLFQKPNPIGILKNKFDQIKGYDYVIIDCAPSLGILNQNALLYCSEAFIPVSTDPLGLEAMRAMINAIDAINNSYEHDLQITKIIPTLYDKRNKICRETLTKMQNAYYTKVTNPIRICSKTKEAPKYKKSIFSYAKSSRGSEDYKQLTQQILQDESFMVEHETPASEVIVE